MRLIIVRHAETKENILGIMMGHAPGELTEKGRDQARRLGLRLRRRRVDAIFSSDLKRVRDTTIEISRHHDAPVHYSRLLRERDAGAYQGRPREEMRRAIAESGLGRFRFKPEGGESLSELNKRVAVFLKRLNERYKGKTVLIITHGGVVRSLMQLCLNMPFDKAVRFKPKNASVITIDVDKGRMIRSSQHSSRNKYFV